MGQYGSRIFQQLHIFGFFSVFLVWAIFCRLKRFKNTQFLFYRLALGFRIMQKETRTKNIISSWRKLISKNQKVREKNREIFQNQKSFNGKSKILVLKLLIFIEIFLILENVMKKSQKCWIFLQTYFFEINFLHDEIIFLVQVSFYMILKLNTTR